MGVPYPTQVTDKQDRVSTALAAVAPRLTWAEPMTGPESGFRNRAKLVVAGAVGDPTLGILDDRGAGVDLQQCGLYVPQVSATFEVLEDFIADLRLLPYNVPKARGELKHVLVTGAPDGRTMVRFVLRSRQQLDRIERHVVALQREIPGLEVVSVNLQPEHKAVIEGAEEIVLTRATTLPVRLDDVTLHLGPRSFFQTNTAIAQGLYDQATAWATATAPRSALDLYCGVGGFALHLARAGAQRVTGVETSPDAVDGARRSAADLSTATDVEFVTADATAYARDLHETPDLVVVNPPRRGIGGDLAAWLNESDVPELIYSSCNVESLARDLAAMPALSPVEARLFDMFPQTDHHEVMVRLSRR